MLLEWVKGCCVLPSLPHYFQGSSGQQNQARPIVMIIAPSHC